MLLNSPKKRQQQVEKTTATILNSMRHTVPYIDIKTASKLLKFTDRGSSKCLNRMVEMKLLRKHQVKTKSNQKMDVFSATKHGREFMDGTWRFKRWTMKSWRLANHNHDMQLHILNKDLQAFAKSRNFNEIEPVKIENEKGTTRRPDFALNINNKIYQIELELTLKSTSRYEDILQRCGYEFQDRPFVWVFTNSNLLNKVFKMALKLEEDSRMLWVLWTGSELKWIDNLNTPLFKQHFDSTDELEIEKYTNTEMYDEYEVNSFVEKAIMKEKKELDKVMRMGFFERKKYKDRYLKTNPKMFN